MLWLPPSERDRLHHEATLRVQSMDEQLDRIRFMETWNRDLKAIDPYLELRWCGERVTDPALKPNRYVVIRRNPDTHMCPVLIVETPEGGYREPDSSLFDEIRKMDGWSDRSARERRKREEALTTARERRKAHEHEERVNEALERFNQSQRTQILVKGAPWRS